VLQHRLRAAHARRDTPTEHFEPVAFLAAAADRYCRANGLTAARLDYGRVVVDPVRGLQLAASYLDAPWYEEQAAGAYRAFTAETSASSRS
jgi:hypothetical protein